LKQITHDSGSGPYLDYFIGIEPPGRVLASRFGIRVREGAFWAVIKIADNKPTVFGKAYPIPVHLDTLPSFVRDLIQDHMQAHAVCDLMELLAGHKGFKTAFGQAAGSKAAGA
jgi:hypothetical protein